MSELSRGVTRFALKMSLRTLRVDSQDTFVRISLGALCVSAYLAIFVSEYCMMYDGSEIVMGG